MSGSGSPIDAIRPGPASESPPREVVELIGRVSECAEIAQLLEHARQSRSGVLVLRGEAGVGKSALLEFAANEASGIRILRVAGVEPESDLAFAALQLMLRPVLPAIDEIPDVQAESLRIAMGLAPGVAENRFVIGLAVLSLLSEVAADGPVLCLIDDAQWLDQPSADALAFVARRLQAEGIVMLFSVREGDRLVSAESGLPERTVTGLDPAEAERLLLERFGAKIVPEIRHVIVEATQGLPLALLEVPSVLTDAQLSGREAVPEPLPIGGHLEEILLGKVHRLSLSAQMLLLIAAAEGSGETDVILSAGAVLGISPSTQGELEASGLIHAEGSALVFRHPVLRAAVYEGASLAQRQAAHGALIAVLDGETNSDRRAWHRAALVLHPDDEVADELERAADRARRRSGFGGAYRALRRAAELTSSEEHRGRRLVSAARAAWEAGQADEAEILLRTVPTEMDAGTYAELCHVQGEIEVSRGAPLRGATVLVDGAERIAEADHSKALQMLFDAVRCANFAGDLGTVVQIVHRVSRLPIEASEPEAPLVDLFAGMAAMIEANDTAFRARLVPVLDRLASATDPRWLTLAAAAAAAVGDPARHDALRRRAEAISRRSTAIGVLATVLEGSWSDMMFERVAAASAHSEEGLQLALETGLTNTACFHCAILAWVAAIRGDVDRCISLAGQAAETAMKKGLAPYNSIAQWAVALLHLGLGQWESAATRLEDMSSAAPGTSHPYIALRALPDLAEAGVRAGRLDVAESAANRFAGYAGEGAPDWDMALAARCRALVARSADEREKLLSEALVFHERDRRPFSRARTQLLLGEHLRRQRRRREARVPLEAALVTFEQLGASSWVERTRREVRATGQTVRRRDVASTVELTLQERQVAEIVAEGATNKEAAALLFISPRTVEYHLRSLFSKLGISSRAELVRLRLDERL
jgi:DNA-binding CsgD family transcriptional regulator